MSSSTPEAAREVLSGTPSFLTFGAWEAEGTVFEVASRRRLDTRQVIPYFEHLGRLHVGVLQRRRASRALRGAPLLGLEPIGIDFGGVDETGDILEYGRSVFNARTRVPIDEQRLKVPLPSYARSIGYLTELTLPLFLAIHPPSSPEIDVEWDGARHRLLFRPADALLNEVEAGVHPHSEDLLLLLRALLGPVTAPARPPPEDSPGARALIEREPTRVWDVERLAAFVERALDAQTAAGFRRRPPLTGAELRFLHAHRVHLDGQWWEVVTPGTGQSLTVLPFVRHGGETYFVLWSETRVAALERRVLQPLYDLPMHPRYVNATGFFLTQAETRALPSDTALQELVARRLGSALGQPVGVRSLRRLGAGAEPAPAVSAEVRHRVACELDVSELRTLPDEVFLIRAAELSRAVAEGRVRDPVIVSGLLTLGAELAVDPFREARTAPVESRLGFLDTMTHGSTVQRRLKTYSSIEQEQLQAPTYARLMTLLQHEYGVRVAYPQNEADRSFFKAAFRVFMAADRGENRALQGLHWSHDAFHFALGNHTLPPPADFERWYVEGEPVPPAPPPEGPAFEQYARALKSSEDEATFFSFWTLYQEVPSLARYVGSLTFHEALRDMGITERATSRSLFDALTVRAEIPTEAERSEAYRSRKDIRDLFEYMRGFRDYHLKDIREAWKYATRDMYRGFFLRFGLYSGEADAYVHGVKAFQARLDAYPPGLNPLLAQCADVRVALALRVYDGTKALRLVRTTQADTQETARQRRREFLHSVVEPYFAALEEQHRALEALRARVRNAEMVPLNEYTHADIQALAATVETLRGRLWDDVERTGLLTAEALASERTRELPR
ncbi:hypothetical protein [Hyalangium rubrum]|uniref:Uncharacterized protein n=1 Tax=Hyalangium rubrum TaxID=3103134 RepID=A0ABU5H6X0_9BACT|nr:hypothetical protein [Hyalangium sp. s54d21]MDY7229046.1 hypothetical protein [Hyalangium sp. s54d21]